MNSFSMRAWSALGVMAVSAIVVASSATSNPLTIIVPIAVLGFVAFATQFDRLHDGGRRVYQPVPIRRQSVRRPVRSDDE